MNATLLLDLDDTLLQNDIGAFLPRYLDAFSKYVAHQIDPNLFIASLMAGTQAMVNNRQPDCTLREAFEEVFYPQTGLQPESFQVLAEQFYQQIFPTLRVLTHPIPAASVCVQEARRRHMRLALTTNPLFPRTAILQRLTWAELTLDEIPFEIITSYETFHYAKPDPAYFAEVLARLGWPAGPLVVVGNDPARDILPAQAAGIASYLVDPKIPAPVSSTQPTGQGPIADFFEWFDLQTPEALQPDFSSPSASLAILRATPAALDSILRGLSTEAWSYFPAAGEWGLTEILCHLRDVDQEVNLPRLQLVFNELNPFLPGQDTDPWANIRGYRYQNGPQAFRSFIAARSQLVLQLEALDSTDWQRPARHAIFGPTRLQELVNIIAAHDRLHLQQVFKLLISIGARLPE